MKGFNPGLEEKYDLVVVGGGPAGSAAAYRAAKLGLNVLLLEEHAEAGFPPHCAGKLTVRAFKEFNLPASCVVNRVRGAYFYSPKNVSFKVSKPDFESYIVDREMLDRWLIRRAERAGAELRFRSKVKGVVPCREIGILVKGSDFAVRSSVVVLAEGGCRRLTEKLGFGCLSKLKGIQFEVEDFEFKAEDFVELFFGWRFFPGFFGWVIPLNDGKARVGLCVNTALTSIPPRIYLEKALKGHPILAARAAKSRIVRAYGGIIPIHGPVSRPWHPRGIILVGDAAGHAKSTTGGGVFFGLKAGELAGEAAARFPEEGIRALKFYEASCRKAFGLELAFTSKVRQMLDSLSDQELDEIFRLIASSEQTLKTIEKYGDTAFQSKVFFPTLKAILRSALRKPRYMTVLMKVISKMIWSFL